MLEGLMHRPPDDRDILTSALYGSRRWSLCIMVNGSQAVFVERAGLLSAVRRVHLEERNLKVAVKNITRLLGDDIFEETPILDARLPDGARVAAVIPPCSLNGTTLTIRKFQSRTWTRRELVRPGTLTDQPRK